MGHIQFGQADPVISRPLAVVRTIALFVACGPSPASDRYDVSKRDLKPSH
ncbi:MAG: hypothetical protein ABIU58_06185 [Ramlibacter sp.]